MIRFCRARFIPSSKNEKHTQKRRLSRNVDPEQHGQEFQYPSMVQQTLIQPQVSYLTTLNNVYISETDNIGTPNTESGYIPSGPVSIAGLSHRAEQARTPPR